MAVMRVVPNPEEPQAGYGDIAEAPFPQGVPPANLPGSPPFQMPPLETRSGPAPSYAAGPPRAVTSTLEPGLATLGASVLPSTTQATP